MPEAKSDSIFARLRFWGLVITAGAAFVLEIVRDYFSDSQTMEYIQSHHPRIYAFLSPTHVGVFAIIGLFVVLLLIVDKLVSKPSIAINNAPSAPEKTKEEQNPQTPTDERSQSVSSERESHVVFLTAKAINITLGEHTLHECQTGQGDMDGIKVCFRNEAVFGRTSRDVLGIKANVRFMDKDGGEIGEGVSGVAWLNKSGDLVNIPKDETRCLCLLLRPRGRNQKVFVPSKKRVPMPGSVSRTGLIDVPVELPELPHSAEVRLTGSHGLILPPVLLDIAFENDALTAKARSQEAAL